MKNGSASGANTPNDLPAAVKSFDDMSLTHLEEFGIKCRAQSNLIQEQVSTLPMHAVTRAESKTVVGGIRASLGCSTTPITSEYKI